MRILIFIFFLFKSCEVYRNSQIDYSYLALRADGNRCEMIPWKHIIDNKKVFSKLDDKNRIIEMWGSPKWDDFKSNFRTFFYYDKLGRLFKSVEYNFNEKHNDCTIIEKLDFDETIFYYNGSDTIPYKSIQTYPRVNSRNKVIGREFGHMCDCKTGAMITDTTNPLYKK